MRIPPFEVVAKVVEVLQAAGLRPAVGGSGLLVGLGLSDTANDWDVSVDAAPETVAEALHGAGVDYSDRTQRGGTYATDRRYVIDGSDHQVDLLVNFSLRAATGQAVVLPTRVTGHWRGLPLADPMVWARAYRLLGRHDKADLLEHWLQRQCR